MTNSNPQSSEPRIGSVLAGKYRIERLIGRGGMGSVYEAENTALGKRVALKFLLLSADSDATSLARFHREARAMSTVQSAHVVQIFDWGQDDSGQPFLVMELLDGKDLAHFIKQQGALPVRDVVRYGVEALRGLKRVHGAGIVHRDLKPENLLLVTGDDELLHVKIVDFGLSKLMDPGEADTAFEQSARLTQQGTIVGTPLYMSPEQVEGVQLLDHRTDIWSMGVILYEALAGRPPFSDRSYARLVMAICGREPTDLRELNPEVPPKLAAAIHQALDRNREERFPDAGQFVTALMSSVLPKMPANGSMSGPVTPVRPSPTLVSAALPDKRDTPIPTTPQGAVVLQSSVASAENADQDGALDATLAAHTRGAATVWLTDAPAFSIWRGQVDSPDRLRIEARDGSVRDLRLEPVGELSLGRVERVGEHRNDLVYPDVASRLAARLGHDGIRWWLERRKECSVPVQVGTRALQREERAPLVHGCCVIVGAMRATMVDRRYVSRSVPGDTVDPQSGLLARGGLEQEVATALQRSDDSALLLVHLAPEQHKGEHPIAVRVAVALHHQWPGAVIARDADTIGLILRGDNKQIVEQGRRAIEVSRSADGSVLSCGYWSLEGEPNNAGSEVELALDAVVSAAGPGALRGMGSTPELKVVALRSLAAGVATVSVEKLIERSRSPKNQVLLFAIEQQAALSEIGPTVIDALERELAALITTQVGPAALVTRMAPGVVAACVPRKLDAPELGVAVQCEWHSRPPVTDGKVELPRTLSWEEALVDMSSARAQELSRECADAFGVLSALSGGLPYPIAGRVYAAISASSAVERVKMLFDVLEGTWRFIAVVLASAYFAKASSDDAGKDHQPIKAFHERVKTRGGLPLGNWRELARLAAKGFAGATDPIGVLARELLDVKLTPNQTFDTLSNLMHSERNSFAHGHYNEARAAADVQAFEQMTRTFLRALRPLSAWTLVTVRRTEPDLYGELQTVEFIDHTGPYATGTRRRIGFNSPMRLANVVYLARWRDGLVLPLEPFVRRIASEDRFGLYWMDHLPRGGSCNMSSVVTGEPVASSCDPRRLPPLLRSLAMGSDA